jgi:hypothetical protein
MADEVSVHPHEQEAIQQAAANDLHSAAAEITIPESDGMRPGHFESILKHIHAGRADLAKTGDTSTKGGNAATDIGRGDDESGERIEGIS